MSSGESDPNRQYTCLACEDTVTQFQTECPSCGGQSFRTTRTDTDKADPTPVQRVARATASLNPYAPR